MFEETISNQQRSHRNQTYFPNKPFSGSRLACCLATMACALWGGTPFMINLAASRRIISIAVWQGRVPIADTLLTELLCFFNFSLPIDT